MDALIIAKWVNRVDIGLIERMNTPAGDHVLSGAPSVITTMINIFLGVAETDTAVSYEIIPAQRTISLTLLVIALISVPLMLCVKPCWLNRASAHHADHHAVSHNPERSGSQASQQDTSGILVAAVDMGNGS